MNWRSARLDVYQGLHHLAFPFWGYPSRVLRGRWAGKGKSVTLTDAAITPLGEHSLAVGVPSEAGLLTLALSGEYRSELFSPQ